MIQREGHAEILRTGLSFPCDDEQRHDERDERSPQPPPALLYQGRSDAVSDVLTENVISRDDCIFCARHNCTPISNKMIRATCDALADAEARVEQLATALKTYGYRRHYTCEDAFYSCPKSGERYDTVEGVEQECTCGADQHNAKVDGILAAFGPPSAREEGVSDE